MKPSAFACHDPHSCDDLMALLAELDHAKLLAGGQSLMPIRNLRLVAPDHLIDINRIPQLAGVRLSAERVEIGAMTRQADLLASRDLASVAPVFAQALASRTRWGRTRRRSSCIRFRPKTFWNG